jgi:hypothetical protein
VQILANALPGFRDLRAPLIAGYMWLILAWLIVKPDVDHRPHNALAAAVYDLINEVGQVWAAAAVGVAAYLIGVVSQGISGFAASHSEWAYSNRRQTPDLFVTVGRRLEPVRDEVRDQWQRHLNDPTYATPADDYVARRADEIGALYVAANMEVEAELDLPATLLVADQPALFAEVDRLRAEGEFRVTVALPALVLVLYLARTASPWWLVGLPAVGAVFYQGVFRIGDSRKLIADAVAMGRVDSPAEKRFRDAAGRWLQEGLDNAKPAGQPR